MSRFASQEKGGYYPFPPEHLDAMASLFAPMPEAKLLDPCAGEGFALKHLSTVWKMKPYANELDRIRAYNCKKLIPDTLQGDMTRLRCYYGTFAALWINPPYTEEKEITDTGDKRRELALLKHAWRWVQPGGIVFWIVYRQHLTDRAAEFLANNCVTADVWECPGDHLGAYKQIVVVCRQGTGTLTPMEIMTKQPRQLVKQAEPVYRFSPQVMTKRFLFAPDELDSPTALLASQILHAAPEWKRISEPAPRQHQIHPPVKPRSRQLALILAAGLFNDLTMTEQENLPEGTEGPRRLTRQFIVRSQVKQIEKLMEGETEIDLETGDIAKEVYRTAPETRITQLFDDGSIRELSDDELIVGFIKQYKDELLRYLDEHFTPVYNFDYSPHAEMLSKPKRGGLFNTQKHVIAASIETLKRRRSLILVGEPGVGKTIMGAAIIRGNHTPYQDKLDRKIPRVNIIICPPHLVEKWKREIDESQLNLSASIIKNLEQASAFVHGTARTRQTPIAIISREAAKLGEGWQIAVHWKTKHFARWQKGEEPHDDGKRIVTTRRPHCPTCGFPIEETQEKQTGAARQNHRAQIKSYAEESWLKKAPRFCVHCDHALWTDKRTFSNKPTSREKPKNPRVPLVAYFVAMANRRKIRIELAVFDELHEMKDANSEQGHAMLCLANKAHKILGLTGTLYGGVASSLYAIEFAANERIRALYPYGAMTQWVKDMGVLERVVKYTVSQDGKYNGRRRNEQAPQEAPGTSPLLLAQIIDHCIFVGLLDMGRKMPDFTEIPVPIAPDPKWYEHYDEGQKKLLKHVMECRMEGDSSPLGMYLQCLLSYPNAAHRDLECIHRKKNKLTGEYDATKIWTMPGVYNGTMTGKENWLVDLINDELKEGRGIGVFCRQTGTRDIQERLADHIKKNCPLARTTILHASVQAAKRESVLATHVTKGTNVLICNPRLVQTGLDLLDFPTLVFYEVDYSLFVMQQASRRAWRIIQDRNCKVYYPYWTDTMEETAVELVGRKQEAAALLYGEEGAGLAALNPLGPTSIMKQLAAEIGSTRDSEDIKTLFKRAASTPVISTEASEWYTAHTDKPITTTPAIQIQIQIPTPAPEAVAVEKKEIEITPIPAAPKPTPQPQPKRPPTRVPEYVEPLHQLSLF